MTGSQGYIEFECIESPEEGHLTQAHLRKGAALGMSRARRQLPVG